MMFEPMSASIEPVRTGKLRALGVTTAARSAALPDVPAVGEFVPGYEASALTGIGAPRDTPAAVIERLNREINAAFVDPGMKARLADTGGTAAARLGGRVRQAICRGNREVGQGGEGFGHQAELIHCRAACVEDHQVDQAKRRRARHQPNNREEQPCQYHAAIF